MLKSSLCLEFWSWHIFWNYCGSVLAFWFRMSQSQPSVLCLFGLLLYSQFLFLSALVLSSVVTQLVFWNCKSSLFWFNLVLNVLNIEKKLCNSFKAGCLKPRSVFPVSVEGRWAVPASPALISMLQQNRWIIDQHNVYWPQEKLEAM